MVRRASEPVLKKGETLSSSRQRPGQSEKHVGPLELLGKAACMKPVLIQKVSPTVWSVFYLLALLTLPATLITLLYATFWLKIITKAPNISLTATLCIIAYGGAFCLVSAIGAYLCGLITGNTEIEKMMCLLLSTSVYHPLFILIVLYARDNYITSIVNFCIASMMAFYISRAFREETSELDERYSVFFNVFTFAYPFVSEAILIIAQKAILSFLNR